jgi:VWFA-related protein
VRTRGQLFPKECSAAILLGSMLAASCGLRAQTPVEPTVRIRKTVRLVEVDVIAKEKRGKPVSGLTAKDFVILDNGQPQKISRFSVEQESSDTNVGQPAPMGESKPNQDTFSNTHPGNLAATVILYDLLNTPFEDQASMRKQLLQSLNRLKPGTPIALLMLGDDLTVVSDFTTSTISLANAIAARPVGGMEGFGPPITARATGNPVRDAMIARATSQAFHAENRERVMRTLAALNVICDQLGRMRGRKSLLWITAGLSMPGETHDVQVAIDKLNDANVAVYTVDARGVVLDPGMGADVDTNDMTAPLKEEREETRADAIEVIARSTGGVFYHNTNRLDTAISRAIEDRSMVYTLAYYPQHNQWQGEFHKLLVKTLRPGVQLRYRTGYLATPTAAPSVQDEKQMLAAAAASPLDSSGIRFSVEVKPAKSPGDRRFVLHFPVEELQFAPQNEMMVGSFQVWFIQRRASGDDLGTTTLKGDWRLVAGAYQAALRQGVGLVSDLKVKDGAAKIRVLVRDTNSGRIGTVDVPVAALPGTAPAP